MVEAGEHLNLMHITLYLFNLTVNGKKNIQYCQKHHPQIRDKETASSAWFSIRGNIYEIGNVHPVTLRDLVSDHRLMVCHLGDIKDAATADSPDGVGCMESCVIFDGQGKWINYFPPTALRGRLLISSTCTTCSSDKHEAEVCFNQRSYSVRMMVKPRWCW